MGRGLGCWTGKDNRAGVAVLAEGLVFQAQQRILSSSSGPQRGGTLEMAQSLQSPACEVPEGNLWVWSALDTRLQFPASSPIPCSPQVLLSIPDRPEEAEAPEARKRLWS